MRMSEAEYADFQSKRKTLCKLTTETPAPIPSCRSRANKTENEYRYRLELEFVDCRAIFEGLKIMLDNGHRYSPDWVVKLKDGTLLCVEVKSRGSNGFRQPSYHAARLNFDQCRIDWPMFHWRWAEKYKGQWIVNDYMRTETAKI